ncbi:unknown [Collinsella sp. CAG:398]|nr:unknown [Collinsella sp. CAG:398]
MHGAHDALDAVAMVHVDDERNRAVASAGDHVLDEIVLAVGELGGVHRDDRGGVVGLSGLDHGAEQIALGHVVGAHCEVLLLRDAEHLVHVDEHSLMSPFTCRTR